MESDSERGRFFLIGEGWMVRDIWSGGRTATFGAFMQPYDFVNYELGSNIQISEW